MAFKIIATSNRNNIDIKGRLTVVDWHNILSFIYDFKDKPDEVTPKVQTIDNIIFQKTRENILTIRVDEFDTIQVSSPFAEDEMEIFKLLLNKIDTSKITFR